MSDVFRLRNDEIMKAMEDFGIPLAEDELNDPGKHKERIRYVFKQLLCKCWGIAEDDLPLVPNRVSSVQSSAQHPSLYKNALVEAKIFSLLSKLMIICGCQDFGLKDLHSPHPKRFRMQLCAVINFEMYRGDKIHMVEDEIGERIVLYEALDEARVKQEALMKGREAAENNFSSEMSQKESAEEECQQMNADLTSLNKEQSSIRQENSTLNKRATELKNEIATIKITLDECQVDERKLMSKIVVSPGQIKMDLEGANGRLGMVKRKLQVKKDERKVAQKKMENTVQAEELAIKLITAISSVETKLREFGSTVGELDDIQSNLDEVQMRRKEKQDKIAEMEKGLLGTEQQKCEITKSLKTEIGKLEGDLEMAVQELGGVEGVRLDAVAKVEALQQQTQEVQNQIKKDEEHTNHEISNRIRAFQSFEKSHTNKEAQFIHFIETASSQ